jgi:two-component system, NarL family, nitrate/nitrite response regulator NarL
MILICTHEPARLGRWRAAVAGVCEEAFAAGACDVLRERLVEQPDALLLLDLALPNLHDGDGVEALLAEHHSVRILAFSSRYSDAEGEHLVHIGVQGYLSANADASVISRAVARIRSGSMWLSRPLMECVIRHYRQSDDLHSHREARGRLAQLTPRQQEVARMVAEGLPNKAIARRLQVSERTVKAHLSAIFERTATSSRTELAVRLSKDRTRSPGALHHG